MSGSKENHRMERTDLVRKLVDQVDDDVILVSGIGYASFDLGTLGGDRDLNFYMLGSMGQAISIGLGLAVSQPEREVLVMEGDGSVLLNMSALATIGMVAPPNLTIVILDNARWQITGGQVTATAETCELADVARSCGIQSSGISYDTDDAQRAVRFALDAPGPHVIVAKIDTSQASSARRDDPIEIKYRLMSALGNIPD